MNVYHFHFSLHNHKRNGCVDESIFIRHCEYYLVAVWSLVTIAAERYLAVCQPFKHNNFTKRKALLFFVIIYFMAAFINFSSAFEVSCLQHRICWFVFNLSTIQLKSEYESNSVRSFFTKVTSINIMHLNILDISEQY